MKFRPDVFFSMPQKAKIGVSLWLVSWIWYLLTTYNLTNDQDNVPKMAIAVAILVIFLSQAQNWARIIAVMVSAMGILFSSLFFAQGIIMIATVDVLLFAGAIFYLMTPTVARHFKEHSAPAKDKDEK